ncbi:MAG: hypothetical protein H6712_06065 [Myxococcales bacterium]|nr:hypothetical protein [Myxococcales bacterium]MCB9713402.1 hypothetical protein [Myxococcales bacterium]
MQTVRKVLFMGPCSHDDNSLVTTMELTCGCQVTRTIRGSRVRSLGDSGVVIRGEEECPKGHELPASLRRGGPSFITRALGRC